MVSADGCPVEHHSEMEQLIGRRRGKINEEVRRPGVLHSIVSTGEALRTWVPIHFNIVACGVPTEEKRLIAAYSVYVYPGRDGIGSCHVEGVSVGDSN